MTIATQPPDPLSATRKAGYDAHTTAQGDAMEEIHRAHMRLPAKTWFAAEQLLLDQRKKHGRAMQEKLGYVDMTSLVAKLLKDHVKRQA